jgi:hypothetical protein
MTLQENEEEKKYRDLQEIFIENNIAEMIKKGKLR